MSIHRILLLVALMFSISPNYYAVQQIKQDPLASIEALLTAAEQGDVKSQVELAKAYLAGRGVWRSYGEAVKWLKKAADQGSAEAQTWMGVMHSEGLGVAKDNGKAAQWYRQAAEQGSVFAQARLGQMIKEGKGMARDDAQAARWLREAAEQGEASAQCLLGSIYAEGIGVAQNYVQACMWLNLCARAAFGKKQETAAKLRDNIARQMDPQQVAEARQLADELTARYVQNMGNGPYVAGNGVTTPITLVNPMPSYTEYARSSRINGSILIQCIVRKDGTVDSFKVLRGLGYGLDESAINTIATKWRFLPGMFQGQPVDVLALMEVQFRLY